MRLRAPAHSAAGVAVAFIALAVVAVCAAAWFYTKGYTLYYGDAEAHFNIARRILDSRSPGYNQIGTVWLPFPHLLMLPFVSNTGWWVSGLAASMPGVLCFVAAGTMLFAAARRFFGTNAAAAATTAVFALNPNLLYLQSTPMTEPVFFAAGCGILYCTVAYAQRQSLFWVVGAALFSLCASLTRYDGWWLIPAVTVYFLVISEKNRLRSAIVFGAIASAAPVWWLFHNWLNYGNALEFYNGHDSAIGIYRRFLEKGGFRYPGDHDWRKAVLYFRTAAQLVVGTPLMWIGAAGLAIAIVKRVWWPVILFGLAPVFYVCSMYSSGTPIFIPQLWPNGYYNTRYGLCMLPLLAIGCGAIVTVIPARARMLAAVVVTIAVVLPWVAHPTADAWICWKESQVNSVQRRTWTKQSADFLRANYGPGDGAFVQFGDDFAGVFRMAGIPLRETLNMGDSPLWMVAQARPDLFLWETWAVAQSGDQVQSSMQKAVKDGRFRCVKIVSIKDAPTIEFYRRQLPAPAALP